MKNTIENYGWIVIVLLSISIIIGLASPLAIYYSDNFVQNAKRVDDSLNADMNFNLPYRVKVDSDMAGSGKVELTGNYSGDEVYLKGETVITFKATPNDDYRFLGWYENNKLISNEIEYTSGYSVNKQTDIIAKFEFIGAPKLLNGENQTFYKNVPNNLTFRISSPLSDFQEVKIGGNVVDSSNYTVTEGSTIITFHQSYLMTLSTGSHNITIISKSGAVETAFDVSDASCFFGHTPGDAATCVTSQKCTICQTEIQPATGNHEYSNGACVFCGIVTTGLYDIDNNLIATWNKTSDGSYILTILATNEILPVDISQDYTFDSCDKEELSLVYILNNNS